jgi:hypothetical protein
MVIFDGSDTGIPGLLVYLNPFLDLAAVTFVGRYTRCPEICPLWTKNESWSRGREWRLDVRLALRLALNTMIVDMGSVRWRHLRYGPFRGTAHFRARIRWPEAHSILSSYAITSSALNLLCLTFVYRSI